MRFSKRNESGFTLIELSIAIVIVGLLLAGFLQAYAIYEENRRLERAELLMSEIDKTLENFALREGRLPCPAPMAGRRNTAAVAGDPVLEDGIISYNEEDCNVDGATSNLSPAGGTVRIGKLPAATLEISSEYMKDVYGNYLIYAVSEAVTADASATGAIQVTENGIEDDPGDPSYGQLTFQDNHANVQYVVVSMGASRDGAYAYDGTQIVDGVVGAACDDSVKEEYENCDGDAQFTFSLLSERNNNRFYDDKVLFESNVTANVTANEPAGCEQQDSFMTEGETCPDGWEKVGSSFGGRGNDWVGNANPLKANPGFYNIDPETGDYYFTTFRTEETVAGVSPGAVASSAPGGGVGAITPSPRVSNCIKSSGNVAKTRCFNQQLSATVPLSRRDYNYRAAGLRDPYPDSKRYCPEGWRVVDIQDKRGSWERDRSEEGTNTVEYFTSSVTCGR